jgi:Flp pilus assembly protein TadD
MHPHCNAGLIFSFALLTATVPASSEAQIPKPTARATTKAERVSTTRISSSQSAGPAEVSGRSLPSAPQASTNQGQMPGQTQAADTVARANNAVQKGSFEEALALYHETLRTAPQAYLARYEPSLHNSIGACYAQLGRTKEAIAEFNISNVLQEFVGNYVWLGTIYTSLWDLPMAELYWQKAMNMAPDNADYYTQLAFVSSRLGHFNIAQRAIDVGLTKATYAENLQKELQKSRMIVLLGQGKYAVASQLSNREKSIYADFEREQETRIAFAIKGGPAQLAGLERGDTIVSINGETTPHGAALRAITELAQFGSPVSIRVNRNGAQIERNVVIGIQPNLPEMAAAANKTADAAETTQRFPLVASAQAIPEQFSKTGKDPGGRQRFRQAETALRALAEKVMAAAVAGDRAALISFYSDRLVTHIKQVPAVTPAVGVRYQVRGFCVNRDEPCVEVWMKHPRLADDVQINISFEQGGDTWKVSRIELLPWRSDAPARP